MLNYGLVGVSSILPRFVAGLKNAKKAQAYAVSSRSYQKAQDFAQKYDIPHWYGSYQELFADPSVDIVYICTPNATHYAIALQALQAGKHVLLEKPFTTDVQQAKELFDLAAAKKLFLMEANKAIFLPTTQMIKQLLSADTLGKIEYIYLPASADYPFPPEHWMRDYRQAGGSIWGSAGYGLAWAMYLCDSPVIAAHALSSEYPGQADYLSAVNFKLASGTIVVTILGMEVQTVNRCYLHGTKGFISLDNFWKSQAFTLQLPAEQPRVYDLPYASEFTFYLDHVSELIEKNCLTSPIMTRELTIQTVQWLVSLTATDNTH